MAETCACGSLLRPLRCCAMDPATASPPGSALLLAPQIRAAEEARQALRDGFPASALELGKNLWATGDERKSELAYELLDAAYAALGRESLRQVLNTHRANRDLPSVDILEVEE